MSNLFLLPYVQIAAYWAVLYRSRTASPGWRPSRDQRIAYVIRNGQQSKDAPRSCGPHKMLNSGSSLEPRVHIRARHIRQPIWAMTVRGK